jgi:hypothetical protein
LAEAAPDVNAALPVYSWVSFFELESTQPPARMGASIPPGIRDDEHQKEQEISDGRKGEQAERTDREDNLPLQFQEEAASKYRRENSQDGQPQDDVERGHGAIGQPDQKEVNEPERHQDVEAP